MTTSTDKWYTTKILSSLLVVILLMILILNQSFKSDYALPEAIETGPIEIIEFQNSIVIIEDKPQPKPKRVKAKVLKIASTEIKVVKNEVKPKPEEVVENTVVDTSQFAEVQDTLLADIDELIAATNIENEVKNETPLKPSGPLDWSEKMPEYPGGTKALLKFLSRKLNYPAYEQEIGIEGTVVTSFVVSSNGSIENIEILTSPSAGFTREAKSVVSKMSKWKPGYHNGNAVAVKYKLPLRFRLN